MQKFIDREEEMETLENEYRREGRCIFGRIFLKIA